MSANVTSLPSGEKDELLAAIERLRRMAPIMAEHHAILAGIRRKAFLAYVKEGFTEAQALELCKAV